MTLLYRVQKQNDFETVFFNGSLTEDAEIPLQDLLAKIEAVSCILNMKDVIQINSLGTRAWIHFIRKLEKNRTVVLEECTPAIVNQINITPSFRGKSTIASLYAPYVCPNCNHEHLRLIKFGPEVPKTVVALLSPLSCPNCGTRMEMDELEEEYFACLRRL